MAKKKAAKAPVESTEPVKIRLRRDALRRLREFDKNYGFGYGPLISGLVDWFCSLDEESQLRLVKVSRRVSKGDADVPTENTYRLVHLEDQPASEPEQSRKKR